MADLFVGLTDSDQELDVELPPAFGEQDSEVDDDGMPRLIPEDDAPENLVELPPDFDDDAQGSGCECAPCVPDASGVAEVELPPDFNSQSDKVCSCTRHCASQVTPEVVQTMRSEMLKLSHEDRQQKHFDKVRLQMVDDDGLLKHENPKNKIQWRIGETTVCLSFWQHCHAIGPSKVQEIRKLVSSGHWTHPARMPRQTYLGGEWARADTWFLHMYKEIAQPLAETLNAADEPLLPTDSSFEDFDLIEVSDHPLWMNAVMVPDPKETMTHPQCNLIINDCDFPWTSFCFGEGGGVSACLKYKKYECPGKNNLLSMVTGPSRGLVAAALSLRL